MFRQNKTFRDNAKKLYRELRKKAIIIQKPPSLEEVELANAYNKFFKNQEQFPEWLSEGVTFLIPKTDDTENPKSYWPISCSTALYKVLTSIITERANIFLESNSLLHKV